MSTGTVHYWINAGYLTARRGPAGRWCIPFPPDVEAACRDRAAGSAHQHRGTDPAPRREQELTTWCTIRVGACWPGGLSCWWLPLGGAVGDQAGDGHVGFVEVFASSEVALEDPPLLVLGVGVLHADPFR